MKKLRQTGQKESTIIGIAWYRADQWEKLKSAAADREKLEDLYYEWLADATKSLEDFRQLGLEIRRVDVDIDEIMKWCLENDRPFDGQSRAAFVAHKLKEMSKSQK